MAVSSPKSLMKPTSDASKSDAPTTDPPTSGVQSHPWMTDSTLRLAERLAQVPAQGLVKGWLFQSAIDNAARNGVTLATERRYMGFKDYPVREYLQLLGQAAVRVRADRPALETLRLLGRGVYENFGQSLFGKVILTGLGSGHSGARTGLKLITHVYKMTSNHAIARFHEPSDEIAVIELEDVWSFPDTYHVGILEGAARGFGGHVSASVEPRSLSSAVLTFKWLGAV
jgi:uncharacterized protein (TIGR02265 family)